MTSSKYFTLRHGLLAATILASPLLLARPDRANAQIVLGVVITVAPPLLPVYVQPPMPESGYVWTPGYWAYGAADYYWVPGAWVQPPSVGMLWTPPYWGWNNGNYAFNAGYWGEHVGYYGGVNYGYGYGGDGYDGGRWNGRNFEYNRAANNFGSVHVVNVYQHNLTIINRTNVSYTGGAGGLRYAPSAQDRLAEHDNHIRPTAEQMGHVSAARENPAFARSHNNGHPAIMTPQRPAAITIAPHPTAHPAQQMARPASSAYPVQHAAAPRAPMPVNRPAMQEHPGQQMARPAPSTYQVPHAQAPRPPMPMSRPATQVHQMPQGAAPSHHENDQKKQ